MKALVGAFNQEKALVGAFSVITNLQMELFEALVYLLRAALARHHCTTLLVIHISIVDVKTKH